jgi:hypothetical protein
MVLKPGFMVSFSLRQRISLPPPLVTIPGHNMGLGTKNRQKQTADICKQHLREKYRHKLGLVEEFIVEFQGARKDYDVTRWGQFTDIKDTNCEKPLRYC